MHNSWANRFYRITILANGNGRVGDVTDLVLFDSQLAIFDNLEGPNQGPPLSQGSARYNVRNSR